MFKQTYKYQDSGPSTESFYFKPKSSTKIITDTREITYSKFSGNWQAITHDLTKCQSRGYGDAIVSLNILKDGVFVTIVRVRVMGPETHVDEFWQRIKDRHNL